MKKHLLTAALAFLACPPVFAQTPAPTPNDEEQVVKIATDLIQIDVTVTDKDGKVVSGLTAADFELYENGQLQKIANFSFVSKTAAGATVGGEAGQQPGTSGVTVGAVPGRSGVRRTVAIVVDDLNLSFSSIYYTRKALHKFVNEQIQPGDLVAIIRTGGGVGALQQFTFDKRVLNAAIEKLRWNPLSSVEGFSSVSQNDIDISDRFRAESDQIASGNSKQYTLLHPHDNVDQVQETIRKSVGQTAAQVRAIYAQTTLGTLRYIISGMNELPGRKAMLLFSDGIDIDSHMNDKSRAAVVFDALREVTEVANRSSVIIYPFDARGLQATTIGASDSTYEIIDGHRRQKAAQRDRDFKDSQDGLVFVAQQTGGRALINSFDLDGGIRRALEEQAGYYLLGYVPDSETFDAKKRRFNKFEIKLKRPGFKVSYRSGFFSEPSTAETRAVVDPDRRISGALMSPFAENEIKLDVNALYADDPTDGTYIRSFLHIDANDLVFSDAAEGWKTATFDVAAVAFGNNGLPVDHVRSTYTIKSRGATYDAMLRKGFIYVLILPIKQPGIYQYRVALRDAASGKVGSAAQVVEIPNLRQPRLKLSSVAVEGVSLAVWQNIAAGKVGSGPGQVQVPSTLLYDTVLRSFPAGTVLRYGFEAYNAQAAGGSAPQLEVQARIMQNNVAVIEGNINRFDPRGQADPKRLKISGAIMLKDTLQPGEYVLQVTGRDPVTKQAASQLLPFEIVR